MVLASLLAIATVNLAQSNPSPQPPTLRLGSAVTPVEYAISLNLDPDREDLTMTTQPRGEPSITSRGRGE